MIVLLALVAIFNGFISKRNRVQDAWAQIDVQLKRRYDLIPNLIETVRGYAKYEKGVLTQDEIDARVAAVRRRLADTGELETEGGAP